MDSDPRVAQQYIHRITLCRVRDGYECRIDDANGRAVAILVGHLDFDPADPDPIEFTVERWRVVLPVRPDTEAVPVTLPDGDTVDYTVPLPQPDPPAKPLHLGTYGFRLPGEPLPGDPLTVSQSTRDGVVHTISVTHGHPHRHIASRVPGGPAAYAHDHAHAHKGARWVDGGALHAEAPHDDHWHRQPTTAP